MRGAPTSAAGVGLTAGGRPPCGADTPADVALGALFVTELVNAGAPVRSAEIFVELRGLAGGEPKSLRGMACGVSGERVRQLAQEVERGSLRVLLSAPSGPANHLTEELGLLVSQIERVAPGSDETIAARLAKSGVFVSSPASVVRLADTLGCAHGLRLTSWTARAKFKDDAHQTLAGELDPSRRSTVVAVVTAEMPEVFDTFILFARKFSRGAGVVGANLLADRYALERGVPLTGVEAAAYLEPFAVHVGRHDGDEWFAFYNSANDFLRKAATRVALFQQCSFETLCTFHKRYNRSLYADEETMIPDGALAAVLELAGYQIDGDVVRPTARCLPTPGRAISEVQARMVAIFKQTLAKTGERVSVPRATLMAEMTAAGIRESTAHIYLSNLGIFKCSSGRCRLADATGDRDTPQPSGAGSFVYPSA